MYGQQQALKPLIRQHHEEALGEAQKPLLANEKQQAKGNSVGSLVRVSVEVRCGVTCFRVSVQASSIQRAVNLVKGLYSTSDVKVLFPIAPKSFFVSDPVALEGLTGFENPGGMAA